MSDQSTRATQDTPTAELVVFLTRGMSLDGWHQAGVFEREVSFYRALQSRLGELALVSYGGRSESRYQDELGRVTVLANNWRLPSNLYSVLAPLLHRRAIKQATVIKTHQLNGAWTAAIAKRLFGGRLIVRCGYLWSEFVERQDPRRSRRWLARVLERWSVRAADRVIVASDADGRRLAARHGLARERLRVIPNVVDVERFRPRPEIPKEPGLVVWVGRLDSQKQPALALEAIEAVDGARLLVIGEGPLRPRLEGMARERNLAVEFLGRRPHGELPGLLNRAQLFLLTSAYEGQPKVLLEAMACGLPVVATSVPGVGEVVRHGETGHLAQPTAASLRQAIGGLLRNPEQRRALGEAGRAHVERDHSVERALEQEVEVLRELFPDG